MPGGKNLVVVMSVLVTGVSTALFFSQGCVPGRFWHEASPENPFRHSPSSGVVADTTWTCQTCRPLVPKWRRDRSTPACRRRHRFRRD